MIDSTCQSVCRTSRGCGHIPDPWHGEIWRQLGDLHHLRPVGELLEDSQSQRQLLFGVSVGFALLELRGRQHFYERQAGGNNRCYDGEGFFHVTRIGEKGTKKSKGERRGSLCGCKVDGFDILGLLYREKQEAKLGSASVKCWLRLSGNVEMQLHVSAWWWQQHTYPHTTRTHKPHGTPSQLCDPTYFEKRKKMRATEEKVKITNRREQKRTEHIENRTVLSVLMKPPVDGTSRVWKQLNFHLARLALGPGRWERASVRPFTFQRTSNVGCSIKTENVEVFSYELAARHRELLALAFPFCTFPK